MTDWPVIFFVPLWGYLFVLPLVLAIIFYVTRPVSKVLLTPIWTVLDGVYFASGVVGALFLIIILCLIVAQMVARATGFVIHGSTEFAGYCMAAASFFALAHALNRGAHIRVSILLNATNFTRYWLDAVAMTIAAITATYFARFAIKTNFWSKLLNDTTQGQDQVPEWALQIISLGGIWPWQWGETLANLNTETWVHTPLWFPQIVMSVGATLLAICLWDNLFRLLVNGESRIKAETVE